jgi:hypothetical protein
VASPANSSGAETPVGAPSRGPDAVLVALASMPDELGRTLTNRPLEDLMQPSRDGGWGVIEILCHLRDWDEIFLDRFRQSVEHERPFLPVYDDELWPIERDYRGQDPRKVFDQFRALRAELVALLEPLPAEAWQRPAEHGAYGEVTLHWMADHVCDHDREHLDQVRDALS